MKTWIGMRLFILAALLVAFTPSTALPWGWGTHSFLIKESGGVLPDNYGAVLPDVYAAVPLDVQGQLIQGKFIWQTHYEFCDFVNVAKPDFPGVGRAFGSHNEDFLADHSAHKENLTLGIPNEGYVIVKQNQLISKKNIKIFKKITRSLPPEIANLIVIMVAHAAVELGVDTMLKRNQDPAWGARLWLAANLRDPEIPNLLVNAYGDVIDPSVIRNAEAVFRQGIINYSLAFLFNEEVTVQLLMAQAADQLSQDVKLISEGAYSLDVDPNDLAALLYAAIDLVKDDYFTELSATLGVIKANLDTMCP